MQILDALDVDKGQAIWPQIARWIVGDKQYVIEAEEDWSDPRLPEIVKPIQEILAEEIPDGEIH